MIKLQTADLNNGAAWTPLASTIHPASFASCGALVDSNDNQLIVYAGGMNNGKSVATVQIYDVTANTWR